jgi:hypothetical protein
VQVPIFPDRFFVAPLSSVAVVLSPLLLILAIPVIIPGHAPGDGFFDAIPWMLAVFDDAIPRLPFVYLKNAIVFSIGVLVMCTLAIIAVLIAESIALRLSRVSAFVFDRLTWHQLRQSAFGNDTVGEVGVSASSMAPWSRHNPPFLPATLNDELSALSDRAAAESLSKLRTALQFLAFSEEDQSKSNLLAEYLSWDELVHTAYFKVPRFRKLVCYAIAHSPGFRPTKGFESDHDYPLLGTWYKELEMATLLT